MKPVTLRNVPKEIAKEIERRAQIQRISMNRAVITLLEDAMGSAGSPKTRAVHHDLDHLSGKWTKSNAAQLHKNLSAVRKVDKDLWQ